MNDKRAQFEFYMRKESSLKILFKIIMSYDSYHMTQNEMTQNEMICKLSQANIPINSYALETLKSLSPATQPRRDNVHTKLYQ